MTKVLVLWAAADRNPNLGVRVLAEGMSALARQVWGDETDVELQDFGPEASGVSFGRKAIVLEVLMRRGPVRSRLAGFDVILDSGAGDSFTDSYGLKRLVQIHTVQKAAHDLGVPVVMGPQTIGPFSTRLGRALARRSLGWMRAVVARDEVSGSASSKLGRPVDAVATDVVFALPRPATPRTRDVILNVSGLLWGRNPHVDDVAYRASIRRTIETLLEDGRKVSLVAHVIGPDQLPKRRRAVDNDVPALRVLEHEFGGEPGFDAVVPTDLSEARRMLGSASVVVGSRMHACLNALSMGTPAIPLAYSRKFGPLLADIGWGEMIDLRSTPEFDTQLMRTLRDRSHLDLLASQVGDVLDAADRRLEVARSALAASW